MTENESASWEHSKHKIIKGHWTLFSFSQIIVLIKFWITLKYYSNFVEIVKKSGFKITKL